MPAGRPVDARAPQRRDLASQARDVEREREQIDRRMGRGRPGELLVHVSPDPPGRKVGRAWLRPRTPEST